MPVRDSRFQSRDVFQLPRLLLISCVLTDILSPKFQPDNFVSVYNYLLIVDNYLLQNSGGYLGNLIYSGNICIFGLCIQCSSEFNGVVLPRYLTITYECFQIDPWIDGK